MRNIPLFKVYMPKGMGLELDPILQSGYISQGPISQKFEEEFQIWLGNPYTALVNSGTSALTLALKIAGVGPGTSVITSPFTCLATNEPILTLGGYPIWCDVDPTTGNIDPSKIEKRIQLDTKAVLFVDWAGTPAELNEINTIAHRHGLITIEDAAHSLGAFYRGEKVGTVVDMTCFSFQAIKHLTTVDGGALALSNRKDYERARLLRWFGCNRSMSSSPIKWTGDVIEPGYKMHMNDVNAAIGLEQLKTINERIVKHKANGQYLQRKLKEIQGIQTTTVPENIDSSYWLFTIRLKDPEHRTRISEGLTKAGIGNGIVHTRNDEYSLFKEFRTHLPGLDDFSSRMLNIPCGWWCSQEDLDYIVETLSKIT